MGKTAGQGFCIHTLSIVPTATFVAVVWAERASWTCVAALTAELEQPTDHPEPVTKESPTAKAKEKASTKFLEILTRESPGASCCQWEGWVAAGERRKAEVRSRLESHREEKKEGRQLGTCLGHRWTQTRCWLSLMDSKATVWSLHCVLQWHSVL